MWMAGDTLPPFVVPDVEGEGSDASASTPVSVLDRPLCGGGRGQGRDPGEAAAPWAMDGRSRRRRGPSRCYRRRGKVTTVKG